MCLKDLMIAWGLANPEAPNGAAPSNTEAMRGSDRQVGRERIKFKALATMAVAVKRFQASLNPVVDYRSSLSTEDSQYVPPSETDIRSVSEPPPKYLRSTSSYGSWRALSQHHGETTVTNRISHTHRGHITSYIMKPLQKVKSEA